MFKDGCRAEDAVGNLFPTNHNDMHMSAFWQPFSTLHKTIVHTEVPVDRKGHRYNDERQFLR